MASPPERLTVKRRRDEDPVDALYVQQRKNRASAVWRLADKGNGFPTYRGHSMPSSSANDVQSTNSGLPRSQFHTMKPPALNDHTTRRADTISKLFQDAKLDLQETYNSDERLPAPITRPIKHNEKTHDHGRPTLKPRRFNLAKSSLPTFSPQLVSKPTATAHKKSRRHGLAMLVEEKKKEELLLLHLGTKDSLNEATEPGQEEKDLEADVKPRERPRKRPGVTLEERKWRADNWVKSVEPTTSTGIAGKSTRSTRNTNIWNFESPKTAEELQQIALKETTCEDQQTKFKSNQQKLKTQPKLPKPRPSKIQQDVDTGSGDIVMSDLNWLDKDSTYVYDTYVRSSSQLLASQTCAGSYVDALQGVDHGSIGIIVIDEDEEDLWETFGEIQESESGWNSEEEDENAEDFYGNDYPEDEVNSDDEYGRRAYDYRHGASDDEEFGEGVASWSDEDNESQPRWTNTEVASGMK